ncbi:MAG: YfhO family protein [Bacilli bacterium]
MEANKQLKQRNLLFKEKFNNLNLYLKYTIVFIFIMLIGLLPIEIKNGSFLFSGLFVSRDAGFDGLKQHLLFMNDFISHIKENLFSGGISLFRYDIGLGSDFINHYTYYSLFDPILIVAYIIPLRYIEFSYYLLIMLRLFLTGIFVVMLAKKLGIKKDKSLLIVAIIYVFNTAVLFSAFRHPMFINGPMYLALIFFGYEKIKKNESPVCFIFAVFLAIISQFYIFIYLTFGFVLFEVIDFFRNYKKTLIIKYIKINLYYFLGVMLGGFVFFTQVYATLAGARVGSKGFELYQAIDYAVIIFSNFLPAAGDHYTAGIGNFFVFIICAYFIFKEKKKSSYSIFFVVLLILSFSALFSYALSIGSYVVNRWLFLLALPSSIIVGKYLDTNVETDEVSIKKTARVVSILFIFGIYSLLSYGISKVFLNETFLTSLGILLFVLAILISYLVYKKQIGFNFLKKILNSKRLYKYIVYNSLFVILIVSGIYCFILSPKDALTTYYSDSDLYADVINDTDFYRVEQERFVAGLSDFSNDGIYYGYPSTSSYNSITNGKVLEFIEDYNIVNSNNSVGYNGLNGRTRLLALNHVKYVIIRESENTLPPAGFSFYKAINVHKYDEVKNIYDKGGNILKDSNNEFVYEKANIYINNLYLNFGVIYDSYLTKKDIKYLSNVEKEKLLTKTIVLDIDSADFNKFSGSFKEKKSLVDTINSNNILITNKEIEVLEDGYLSFKILNVQTSEVYVEIKGLKSIKERKSFNTIYSTHAYTREVRNYGYASNMYIENENHLVNLGYYENEDELEVTIKLDPGVYEYNEIGYYVVDLTELESEINSLNQNSLTELEITANSLKGKINTAIDGYMFLSIPYSKGFKVFIDNKEVEVLNANTGYMAVFVQKGNKELEIKYFTPGLEIGLYVSALSLIILILIIRFELVHKTTRNYQTNKNEEENEKNSTVYK